MKSLIAVLMIALLMGCTAEQKLAPGDKTTGPAPSADAGPFPEDYELRIISWLRMNAANPDNVQILSIGQPEPRKLGVSSPEKGLIKGDAVWESVVIVQQKSPPTPPSYRYFYFKDGVIQAVDLK
jgi:hypothetical protein